MARTYHHRIDQNAKDRREARRDRVAKRDRLIPGKHAAIATSLMEG